MYKQNSYISYLASYFQSLRGRENRNHDLYELDKSPIRSLKLLSSAMNAGLCETASMLLLRVDVTKMISESSIAVAKSELREILNGR